MKFFTNFVAITFRNYIPQNMDKNIPSLLFAMIAGSIAATHAAEAPRDTTNLGELVVTAPLKTNPDLIPLNVTQVSASEIEKSGESSLLPVLVAKVPGLFVTERGFAGYGVSGGSAGSVNIRGVGQGNQVLFMIDGQPQWAGVFGHSLADTYVANGVEKVEVVKGPSSLLYGSNAMGGSINLVTHTQTKDGLTGRAHSPHRNSHYHQAIRKIAFPQLSPVSLIAATATAPGALSGLPTNSCS